MSSAACTCGERDAERYPDATDRVIVPSAADCPTHGVSAAGDRDRRVYWLLNRRWFGWKVHILHGFCAWELQLGPHVLQWFYKDSGFRERNGGPFRHWVDTYGGRHAA